MLTLRPTKMLAKRLRIAVPAVPPPVANRVADWCVHEFRDRGWRYLLFCHTATLYPLVIPARGVTDDDSLIKRSIEAMKTCLLGTELEFAFERWIVPELGAVQYAPIPDKAVLSSMNETIMRARYRLEGEAPAELSRWLAVAPLKALGYESPDRAFRSLRGPG